MKIITSVKHLFIVLPIILVFNYCSVNSTKNDIDVQNKSQNLLNKDSTVIKAQNAFEKLPISLKTIITKFVSKCNIKDFHDFYNGCSVIYSKVYFVIFEYNNHQNSVTIIQSAFYWRNKANIKYKGYVIYKDKMIAFYFNDIQNYINESLLIKEYPKIFPDDKSSIAQQTFGSDYYMVRFNIFNNDSIVQIKSSHSFLENILK